MAHLQLIFPLKIVIFHSSVKLPEGNGKLSNKMGIFSGA
jgi:hypothetical protein